MSLIARMKGLVGRGKVIVEDPKEADSLKIIKDLSLSIFQEEYRSSVIPGRRLSSKLKMRPRSRARIKRKRLRQLTSAARKANR